MSSGRWTQTDHLCSSYDSAAPEEEHRLQMRLHKQRRFLGAGNMGRVLFSDFSLGGLALGRC